VGVVRHAQWLLEFDTNRLGHASVDTTTKIYAHAIKAADAIASNTLEEILIQKKTQ